MSTLKAFTSPSPLPAVPLIERANLAHATVALAFGWVEALRLSLDGQPIDPVAHHAPDVEAFGLAWTELVKIEDPMEVIDVALDGFVEDCWTGDAVSTMRDMLMEGIVQPVIDGLRAKLVFRDKRADTLMTRLEALHRADEADDGTAGPDTLRALAEVQTALQAAADQGMTGPSLHRVLDTWANAMGGPRVRMNAQRYSFHLC